MCSGFPDETLRITYAVNHSTQVGNNNGKRRNTNTEDHPDHCPQEQSQKPKKRSRKSDASPILDSVRREVHRNAENLRRESIIPNTLFFPSLSDDVKRDVNLRTAIGVPLEDLKTVQMRGKKMAWAKFATETDCLDTLVRLRLMNSAAKVSFHRPKQTADPNGSSLVSNNLKTFQKRLEEVRENGGVGNTLMFWNLPIEVESDELTAILKEALEKRHSQNCNPLRIRTAISKNGKGRHFWVVYSGVSTCQAAFVAIHLTPVSFRCGRTIKIHASIHDDSTDADEKKRRQRATELGIHPSAATSEMDSCSPKRSNLDLLEQFLRQNRTSFVFMSPETT